MIEHKRQRRARGTVFYRGKDENGHDMYTATNYTGDVFYDNWDARGDGETGWRKVDISLAAVDAGWRVQFAPYVATMPLLSTGNLLFADKRAESGKRKNMQWELEALAVAPVQGVASGREVIYTDAYGPGAHLVYRAQRHGIAKLVRIDPTSEVAGPFVFRAHLPAGWKVVRQGESGDYELLPTGKKDLNTNKRTAFVGDDTETYAAPFRWEAGGPEQRGILTVTAEHIGGNVWEITKRIPAQWDRTRYLDMDITAASTLNTDGDQNSATGSTYAAKATSATGSVELTASVMTNYHKGSATTRYCYRNIMIFTNTIPGAATVTQVKIKVRPHAVVIPGVAHRIALTRYLPADYNSPAAGDYAYTGGMPSDTGFAYNDISAASASAYTEWTTTSATFLNNVNKGAKTGWTLRNFTNTAGADKFDLLYLSALVNPYSGGAVYVDFEASNMGGAYPPVEEIDYTLPPSGDDMAMLLGVW